MEPEKKAVLVLAEGSIFFGHGFGALARRVGEIVFTTNMTGYEESLTDPSYAGQILVSTYPLIGNYGMHADHRESKKIQIEGYVIRQLCSAPHHAKSNSSLAKAMETEGIPGIYGIDTRKIVKIIRESGVMPACISVYEKEEDIQELIWMAKNLDYSKINFVERVSQKEVLRYGNGNKKVVLIDYGAKFGIIKELTSRGCTVIVVPYSTTAEEIETYGPDGILISNGPGDPALLGKESAELKKLFDYPMFGICLGNQLLAQAVGAKTYKLKFGHRGGNHPVLDIKKNKVVITTQNHGYAVDEKSLPVEFEVTHRNLIDNTIEGISHKELPIFAVQYHPEANPGPYDSKYLFDEFVKQL
ncbi:MAG: glutamine-hydrolyzing carbamoyl-phosphate synthase small subunit [Candidatus Micrarchaeota archaeon]|nr:glutamine-hydrolyzing carbamoyl-phosphate synthase small subunit [Candidatus Micrarchaeota archaeon]